MRQRGHGKAITTTEKVHQSLDEPMTQDNNQAYRTEKKQRKHGVTSG